MTDFESLIAEAECQPFKGWDFSWIKDRVITRPLPWNYPSLVQKYARRSSDMLDLGTGGGELLASLSFRPTNTLATEAYPPNVHVAARRLHPLNVAVVQVGGAPDNNVQTEKEKSGLPFRNGAFHLVINRHESYVPREVARILTSGGLFITQQVGEQWSHDFHRLLKAPLPRQSRRPWNLALAKSQLKAAGLRVTDSGRGLEVMSFADIGAFAWYLRAIAWSVTGFSIGKYRQRLRELHLQIGKVGPLRVRQSRFWLMAVKKGSS